MKAKNDHEYKVTKIIHNSSNPTILSNKQSKNLSIGDVLTFGSKIETHDSFVELRDREGFVLRLGPKSDVAYELPYLFGSNRNQPSESGILVFFGEIYKYRKYTPTKILGCAGGAKYRTSCWACIESLYAENLDEHRDAFYAVDGDINVWEWDEIGNSFDIVTIPDGYKAILHYDDSRTMRDRYTVEQVLKITDIEWDRIVDRFLNPKNWQTSHKPVETL